MKILLTGLSGQQCGKSPMLKYVTVSSMVRQALEDAGHEVDNRKYTWDEDITRYDAVVLGMVPPFSIGAGMLYSGLKAFADSLRFKVPVLLYVDDPNYYQFKNQYPSINRGLFRIYRESMYSGRYDYDNAVKDQELIGKTIKWLTEEQWPTLVIPAYEWGNRDNLPYVPTVRPVYADPSAYVPDYPIEFPYDRERKWVIGGIVNPTEWIGKQSFTWPIEMYGNAKYNDGKLTEDKLVQRFAEVYGILCQPRRATLASGWWRSRYLFAAKTKTIVLGDPADMAPLGKPYTTIEPQIVESASDEQLTELANAQAEVILSQLWSKERYSQTFNDALLLACEEHDRFTW